MWYKELGFLDLILLMALIAGGISGFRSGVIVELSSIIVIGFSIFFYTKFYSTLTNFINPWVDNKVMLPYLSAAALFFLTSIASMVISRVIRFIVRMTPMGIFDRGLGALIGCIKWVFFASILIWMMGMANKKLKEKYISKSLSNKILHAMMPKVFDTMTEWSSKKSKNPKNMMKKKANNIIKKKVNPELDF